MNTNSIPAGNTKSSKTCLILHNQQSGGDSNGNLLPLLEQQLAATNWRYLALQVSEGIEERLQQELQTQTIHRIIAAGGDGTLNLAAKFIHGSSTELAIIPTGSANGMAHELQIPLDIEQAIDLAITGSSRTIDILCLNGKHFCLHLSDMGFNARVVKRFEEGTDRGMWGYIKQFFRELFDTRTSHFTVQQPNGQSSEYNAYMVIAANASRYGTGAVINPDARLDDGLFELCILKRMPLRGMIRLQFSMWLGNVKNHPWTTVKSFEEVTIVNTNKLMVQTDGELLGELPEVHVKVFKQALQIITPKS